MGEIEWWFSYSEDDGFRRHASADEAKAAAQSALDGAVDWSDHGWPEDTHEICWGEVREAAVETVVHEHGPDCRPLEDDEGDGCTEGHTLEFDYVSRFDLTPTTQAAEATARAEAAEQRAEAAEAEVARVRAEGEAEGFRRGVAACVADVEGCLHFAAKAAKGPHKSERLRVHRHVRAVVLGQVAYGLRHIGGMGPRPTGEQD